MSSPDRSVELTEPRGDEGKTVTPDPDNRSEASLRSPHAVYENPRTENPEEGSRRSSRSDGYHDVSPVAVRSIIDWELGKREGSMDVLVSFYSDQIGSIVNFIRIIFYTNPVDIVIVSLVRLRLSMPPYSIRT